MSAAEGRGLGNGCISGQVFVPEPRFLNLARSRWNNSYSFGKMSHAVCGWPFAFFFLSVILRHSLTLVPGWPRTAAVSCLSFLSTEIVRHDPSSHLTASPLSTILQLFLLLKYFILVGLIYLAIL